MLDWNSVLSLIILEISELYVEHIYLLDKLPFSNIEKNEYLQIANKLAKETDYQKSLKKLSKYLYEYHKEKVVILIDEYDTPIQTSYTNGFYQDAISFMRNLLSGAYKDNEYCTYWYFKSIKL